MAEELSVSWVCPLAEDCGQLVYAFHWTPRPQAHFLFAHLVLHPVSGMSHSHVHKFWVLQVFLASHPA